MFKASNCCCTQAQAALAGAVVALAASPGEDLLLVALASARLLSLDIGRLDALQVIGRDMIPEESL